MAYHYWAWGQDQAENGFDLDMLPQREVNKTVYTQPDYRMGRVGHVLTTTFNPDPRRCSTDGGQIGVSSQATYLSCREVKEGDVFAMMGIPMYSVIRGFHWQLRAPAPGLVLDFGLRGCAKSLGGERTPNPDYDPNEPDGPDNPEFLPRTEMELSEINIPLLEGFDAGAGFDKYGEPLEECYYPNGYVCVEDCLYADQNDMLNMRIAGLAEDTDLTCLDLKIAVHIDWLCKPGVGVLETKAEGMHLDYGFQQPTRIV